MNDVELDYNEADYQNLTTHKLFQQTYQSRIQEANPKSPMPKLRMLLAAKWREFQATSSELMPPKSLHHHDPISAKGNGSPKKVNPRYVKLKEAKVQKSATMTSSNLQPSTTTPTTVMSLRPRGIF